jgi:hypothetical protein
MPWLTSSWVRPSSLSEDGNGCWETGVRFACYRIIGVKTECSRHSFGLVIPRAAFGDGQGREHSVALIERSRSRVDEFFLCYATILHTFQSLEATGLDSDVATEPARARHSLSCMVASRDCSPRTAYRLPRQPCTLQLGRSTLLSQLSQVTPGRESVAERMRAAMGSRRKDLLASSMLKVKELICVFACLHLLRMVDE